MRLCVAAAELGNPASASDAGVGALLARAGLEGAVLNVLINLGQLKDAVAASAMRDRARSLSEEGARLEARALSLVRTAIGP